MWFKQISFFRLNPEQLPTLDTLTNKLTEQHFSPVTGLDWFSEGFSPPYHFSPEIVFPADFTWAIALKKSEKVLPASVIRDLLEEKIAHIKDTENRNIGRKEKQELKEQITDDLLPRAFTRSSRIQAICDTRCGFLLINQSATNKAENLLSQLRQALGGLEASLPQTQISPATLMTEWLARGSCEGGFDFDQTCELKGQGDIAAIVKITKQDLTADEVLQHLKTGKTVTQLGLIWREQIAFVLTADFTLKRIQYLDILQEQAENQGDDEAALTFATQILMTEALSTMLQELIHYLGGWQK